MNRCVRLLVGVAMVAMVFAATPADDEVTLEGSFVWSREDGDRTGDLEAVFSPRGDGEWSVTFHFEWEDQRHVYRGTASGNLTDGALQGEVEGDDDDHKLTFRFNGRTENGTFTGTHGYLNRDGELLEAGTLTLQAG